MTSLIRMAFPQCLERPARKKWLLLDASVYCAAATIKRKFLGSLFRSALWFILLALTTLPHNAFSADKVTGIYASQAISQCLPWIAEDAGIFKKYNLDFQLIYVASAAISTAALLGGDADIALTGGAGVVRAFIGGASDLVVIGAVKNILTHSILAGQKIKNVEGLKGKKIGVTRLGSNSHYFTVQALRLSGLDPERDVTLVQTGGVPENLAALTKGIIDAATMTSPGDATAISQGFHYVVYGPDLRLPYANTIFATRRPEIAKRSAVVGRFMRAMAEAAKILHTDKGLTYRVLRKRFRIEDNNLLDAAYNPEIKALEPKLEIKYEAIQAILNEVSQTDPRAKKVKPNDLTDNRYLEEMQKSGFLGKLWEERS
jgi:ABC-type nitrate/sulfonate/bicarbonate transport system substrate-binding protein